MLAHLHGEPGAEGIVSVLTDGAAISAVNLAEVLSKLSEAGADPDNVMDDLQRQGTLARLTVVDLTVADAVAIARMHNRTRSLGLSFADRACLALGQRLQLPVFTADRAWSKLKVNVRVTLIR